jgi:NADH-quinone oxidoreductase subunit H
MERKVIARVGDRYGPNRAGPLGVFQALADALKMLTKEDVMPTNADKWLFIAAPIIIIIPAVLLYAVLPFGRGMVGVDLSIGVVFIVAMGAIPVLSMLMAGWGSNNKYALMGGFRAVNQLLAYEIPMVIALLTVVLLAGTMSTVGIVEAQSSFPFILVTPVAFIIYFLAGLAELGRTPFDLLEADSEIVAGYFIEYSGMNFALFFLAEFINLFMVAGMITTLFLGGWQWPILPSWLWFLIKTVGVIFRSCGSAPLSRAFAWTNCWDSLGRRWSRWRWSTCSSWPSSRNWWIRAGFARSSCWEATSRSLRRRC